MIEQRYIERTLQKAIDLAATQFHAISREQALSAGMNRWAIERMHERGWHRVFPGVYLTRPVDESQALEQLSKAALLWAGAGAVISHRAAGALWGFEGAGPGEEAEITIPTNRSMRKSRAIVHRADLEKEEHTNRRGLPITTPLRTLLDLAAVLDGRSLARAVNYAWRKQLVGPSHLRRKLDGVGRRGRKGAALLTEVLDDCERARRPLESALEVDLWWMIKDGRLPLPMAQHPVSDGRRPGIRLDFAYVEKRLALEVDSMAFHGDKKYFVGHCERLTRLAALGWRVMHVTKVAMSDEEDVRRLIRAGLS